VDDAIVMLENIVRHMERGETVLEAALNGSKEISFTILSMTLSLAAVFIPVLFLGGILGPAASRICRDHRHGGFGLGFCLPHPHTDALQPVPTPPSAEKARSRVCRLRAGFQLWLRAYDWSLRGVLRHRLQP